MVGVSAVALQESQRPLIGIRSEFSWQGWQSIQKAGKERPGQSIKVAANQAWWEYLPSRCKKVSGPSLESDRNSPGRAGRASRRLARSGPAKALRSPPTRHGGSICRRAARKSAAPHWNQIGILLAGLAEHPEGWQGAARPKH